MEVREKKHYLVLECTVCNRYLLAISVNKTRTCPYCGKRVAVGRARVVSRSQNAEEARFALQKLKMHDQKKETSGNEMLR
jgi:DNA-directed RNA polymerase subunit RPC12/RpoP